MLGLEGIVSKRKDSAYRFRPLSRLAQNEEPGCAGRKAGRRGGLGKRAVTELERKHLVETDRHIAECKEYIAKQRELIERAIQRGRSTEVAERAWLRTFVVRCGLPYDPPVGGHSCNGGMIPRFHREVSD